MKNIVSIVALLVSVILPARAVSQYPIDIHNNDLRVWLKSNMYDSDFNGMGYDSAREQMFSYIDNVNGTVYCIYSDFSQSSAFTTYLNPINTEHIVPQFFYGSSSPMRSDLHNIRPSHSSVNSSRSNTGYGEVPDDQANWYGLGGSGNYISLASEPASSANFSEGNGSIWEPQEDRKGDVARQVFHFYTVYPTEAGPITDLADLNTLYQWHLNDPADNEGLIRNDRIEVVQGNRNPYIDEADLVFDAWLWEEVIGCTDSTADNYDVTANTDDGSCTYSVFGCTDSLAINYDTAATVDDGSCTYDSVSSFTGLTYDILATSAYGTNVRIYAHLSDPTHQIITIYGDENSPLTLSTQGTFFQHEEGGPTSSSIYDQDLLDFPDLNYDSWVTIGTDSRPNNLNLLGVDFTAFENGSSLIINDSFGGGWYVLGDTEPSAFPDADGRVLIAQLTSTDDITFTLSIQTRNQSFEGFLDYTTINIPIETVSFTCDHPLSYNYGSSELNNGICLPYCTGDFNGDRLVDIDDFLIFQPAFNTTCD